MNESSAISDKVLEDIKKHFKFLFERGYEIDSTKTQSVAFDTWEVILKHQDFFVKLYEEKGRLDVSFGSPSKGFMSIRALIHFLSNEKDFVGPSLFFGGMKTEAKLLQKYIDRFESGYETEFPSSAEEFRFAEERYYARVR
jgi:hypothetical protein